MIYYLLLCRSVTHAQRMAKLLNKHGIPNNIILAPEGLGKAGCTHAVKVRERLLSQSIEILREAGVLPKKLFRQEVNGSYKEERL